MDKKDTKKVVVGFIMLGLAIAAIVGAAVYVVMTGIPEIQFQYDSAAYKDFMAAIMFQGTGAAAPQIWFLLGGTIAIYLGIILFVADLIVIILKRSFRFLMLPIAGACLFEMAAFLAQAYYRLTVINAVAMQQYLILGFTILCAVLGLACFILGMVFPRRLVARADDEEAPVKNKGKGEEPEEEPGEKPVVIDEEEEEEPEEEQAVERDAAPAQEEEAPAVAQDSVTAEEVEEEPEPEEEPVEEPEEQPEEEPVEEPAPEEKPKPGKKPAAKKAAAPAPVEEPEAPAVAPSAAPTPAKPKVVGKYEVFPEAGFFKFRLKANNGEILVVSNPYRTLESALAGIETLKKNVPHGNSRVIVDKNGFGQFRIFTANDSRLVVAGEIYPTAAGAEKALASLLRFYEAEKIVTLEEIPEDEHREWAIDIGEFTPLPSGKITVEPDEDGKFIASLFANNGELLFETSAYSSKPALKKALANLTEKLVAGKNVTIAKDKQNRFQFRIYSDNGMLLLMGQTYPSYDSAANAAHSARNFIKDAKVVE